MEKNIFKIKILLASPGNLNEDWEKVFEIVKNINLDSGQRGGFVAEVVSWESHTYPAAGENAQAVINDQFPDDIDVFVGMMGSYFGTPTPKWGSGTEEEFRIAYDSWSKTKSPKIMFYFSDASVSINQIDPEQLKKRNEFREELGNLGVYHFTYTDINAFQFDLMRHISSTVHEILKNLDDDRSESFIPQESATHLKHYNDLLDQEPLIRANALMQQAANDMFAYGRSQRDLTQDITKLSKSLVREHKNIERAQRNNKPKKIVEATTRLLNETRNYADQVKKRIPELSDQFINSAMLGLRSINIIKDHELEAQMPFRGIIDTVRALHGNLKGLSASIRDAESSISQLSKVNLEFEIQIKTIIALHKDLISSLEISIELLTSLEEEVS